MAGMSPVTAVPSTQVNQTAAAGLSVWPWHDSLSMVLELYTQ